MDPSILTSPIPNVPNTVPPSGQAGGATANRGERLTKKPQDVGNLRSPAKSFTETLQDSGAPLNSSSIAALKLSNPKITKDSPVLSFVTGQLENVNPHEIPALVTKNAFLNTALSTEDLTGFMQTPMALGDILKALGLDGQIANKAMAAGIDLQEVISPRELLKGLGIDPSRVVAEISLLKQNLPIDGVSTYMQRAAVLRGQTKVDSAGLQEGALSERPNPLDLVEQDANKHVGSAQPELAGSALAFAPQVPSAPTVAKPTAPSNIKTAPPSNAIDTASLAGDLFAGALAATASLKSEIIDLNAAAMPTDMPALAVANPNLKAASMPMAIAAPESLGTNQAKMKAPVVSSDPYALLGEQMLQNKTDVSALATPIKLGDNTTMDALLARQFSNNMQGELKTAQPLMTGPPLEAQKSEAPAELTTNWLSIKPQDQVPSAKLASDAPRLLENTALPSFAVAGLADAWSQQDKGFGSGLENSDDDSDRDSQGDLAKPVFHAAGTEKLFDLDPKITAAPKMESNVAARADMIQKLLDGATVAMKQGGSTIRVNFGSTEHGPMDIALQVNNGVVDLRLITDSKDMRNMIGQDLPKLREALSQQNLTLGKVEVGVDSGWAQSFAGQNGQRWNNQATRNWEEMIEQSSKKSVARPAEISADMNLRSFAQRGYGMPRFSPRDVGGIQVAI